MRKETIVEVTLVLGMILYVYGFGLFNFYIITCLICLLFVKISKGRLDILFTKAFCWYLGFFVIVRLMRLDFDLPLGIFLNILFLGFFCGTINTNQFISVYRKVAYINIAIFFVQFLMKILIGHTFLGILPLPSVQEYDLAFREARMIEMRPCALFPEPSHMAQFLLPLLCIELFHPQYNNRVLSILVIILAILLSSSGCGYLGLLVVAFMYMLFYLKKAKKSSVIIYVVLFSFLVMISIGTVLNTSVGQELIERQEEFSGDSETASGFVRGVRGYYIYDEMSITEKIVGIPKTQVQKYADKTMFWQSFAMDNNGIYLNNVQRLIINDGIICTILFLIFLLDLGKRSNFTGKAIVAVFIVLSFIESMYFSASMALFIVAAYLMKDERVERRVKALHL